jgi:hypothetical protein
MRSTEPDEPVDPATFPPELQEALQRMSARGDGRVIDMVTGKAVAEDGRMMVACSTPGCESAVPRPDDAQWQPLWNAGWRWTSDPAERPLRLAPRAKVYSCPGCPPVA